MIQYKTNQIRYVQYTGFEEYKSLIWFNLKCSTKLLFFSSKNIAKLNCKPINTLYTTVQALKVFNAQPATEKHKHVNLNSSSKLFVPGLFLWIIFIIEINFVFVSHIRVVKTHYAVVLVSNTRAIQLFFVE